MTSTPLQGSRFTVLEGRDGWLFLDTELEHDILRLHTDPTFWDRAVINAWCRALQARREYFATLGITHLTVIAPSTCLVYPEALPQGVELSGGSPFSRIDAGLDERTAAECLDLLDALVSAKTESPTYLQTDSHWSEWGAFIGYQATMRHLAAIRPDIRILDEDDVEWSNKQYVGALGAILPEPRTEIVRQGKVRDSRCVTQLHIATEIRNSIKIVEQDRPELPSAVIFRDSSMSNAINFFSESFRRTVYCTHANSVFRDLVERERPDVVITLMGDRRMIMPPRDSTRDDLRLLVGDLLTDNLKGIESQVLSRSLLSGGDADAALEANDVALNVEDHEASSWWGFSRRARLMMHRSKCNIERGDLVAALDNLREATVVAPDDGPVWIEYGTQLQKGGRGDEAISAFTQATSVEPQNPVVWMTAIRRLLEAGRTAEAADFGVKAAETHPRDPEVRHTHALALAEDGSLDAAVEEVRIATSIAPAEIAYRQTLASVLLRLGLWADAAKVLEELEVDVPDEAEYVDLLAWARSHIGDGV